MNMAPQNHWVGLRKLVFHHGWVIGQGPWDCLRQPKHLIELIYGGPMDSTETDFSCLFLPFADVAGFGEFVDGF